MTTVERLKIRCYKCNQLLAVPSTKAGSVVACPKCKADLLVPRPEGANQTGQGEDAETAANLSSLINLSDSATAAPRISAESPSFLEEIAAVIPPELAALRPEDLRVEAEFLNKLSFAPAPTVREEPAPSLTARSDPFQFPESFSTEDLPRPPEKPLRTPASGAFEVATEVFPPITAINPAPPPLPVPTPDPVIPPIQFDTPAVTLLPPGPETRRISEVTLPATVVVAWSLFVLLAIAMSFLAGLMIGHFLWRSGP